MLATIILLLLLALPASAADGIDPTEPPSWLPSAPVTSSANQVLESILISGQQRLAVIGGETYREGDRWGERRIRTIYRDRVVLSDGQTLRLFPSLSELSQEGKWE